MSGIDTDGDGIPDSSWPGPMDDESGSTDPAPMSELDQNMARAEQRMKGATDKLEQSINDDGFLRSIDALGETISEFGHALGDNAFDGMGEVLEDGWQKELHSEEFGSGFLQETGEMLMAVAGEFAEGVAESTIQIGEAGATLSGGLIEGVGGAAENVWDAGADLFQGDLGGAYDHAVGAVKDVGGLVETTFDTGAAVVGAGFEVVEGVAAIGGEVVEGAAEMVVGLGSDIADGAEAVWDWATGDE